MLVQSLVVSCGRFRPFRPNMPPPEGDGSAGQAANPAGSRAPRQGMGQQAGRQATPVRKQRTPCCSMRLLDRLQQRCPSPPKKDGDAYGEGMGGGAGM